MYNAFYYEESYYLLPEAFTDYDSFLHTVYSNQLPMEVLVVPLRENHSIRHPIGIKGQSMAPYFLHGYDDTPYNITISSADNLYPVQAEIYSLEEYSAKLRKLVLTNCPGCLRYKPLSNRMQSLNGHFEEMSLDGVCLFRQESKPAPRIFHHSLFSFGGFYMRFNFFDKSASEMLDELKQWFHLRYADAESIHCGSKKELILHSRKNELLSPILTNAVSHYLDSITNHSYHIELAAPIRDIQQWIDVVLSKENKEAFQKECKKYGVSIGILEYDAPAAEKIRKSLKPLVDHFWIFPLLQEKGKEYYLLTDTSSVLKELRYRSPLLQAYHTQIGVHSQYGRRRYTITFDMPNTEV